MVSQTLFSSKFSQHLWPWLLCCTPVRLVHRWTRQAEGQLEHSFRPFYVFLVTALSQTLSAKQTRNLLATFQDLTSRIPMVNFTVATQMLEAQQTLAAQVVARRQLRRRSFYFLGQSRWTVQLSTLGTKYLYKMNWSCFTKLISNSTTHICYCKYNTYNLGLYINYNRLPSGVNTTALQIVQHCRS